MVTAQYFKDKIPALQSAEFKALALELFRFQAHHNAIYQQFLHLLRWDIHAVKELTHIPFMPIGFFKHARVGIYAKKANTIFSSSGTTGQQTSRHHVYDTKFYESMCLANFARFYGEVSNYCVLALLPSYLEREGSSLIYMAERFIAASKDDDSGFFLNDLKGLSEILRAKQAQKKKVLLLGVTFALLDLAEQFPQNLDDVLVMETGGMKGRRKEMLRTQVHEVLSSAFRLKEVHSEYGMTELLSQAYSRGQGRFQCPPQMRVYIREVDDPLSAARLGKTGGVNIIDLANVESCAFLQTQDLGRAYADGSFEILGRFDNAEIRGCNLMVV